jgi:ubiquinone/menaquinone biosynthesis C-methylase UbiE
MDARDRDRIISRYDARFAIHGDDRQTLASGPEERHHLRFSILKEVGIANGHSVLDVGCGFGDFSGWLERQGVEVAYTGVDINPRLIDTARKRYPRARFEVVDLQESTFSESFDFVVSSSAFNLKLQTIDNYTFASDMLRRAYAVARRGVAVDFLSSYADFYGDEAFHYEPERMLALAKAITKRVCLRHDYPLFEFCVYLYPDFAGWGKAKTE